MFVCKDYKNSEDFMESYDKVIDFLRAIWYNIVQKVIPFCGVANIFRYRLAYTNSIEDSNGGETTVAKLIARFWNVCEGSINIWDVNVRYTTKEDLMNTLSYVFYDNARMVAI